MQLFNRFRLVHWLIASFFIAAFVTGEDAGQGHVWLGYGLIAAVLIRLLCALLKIKGFVPLLPQLRQWQARSKTLLSRILVIALLIGISGASVTGLMMVDNSKNLNLTGTSPLQMMAASAQADNDDDDHEGHANIAGNNERLEEVHEVFANGTLLIAMFHIGYVWMFRRRMAWRLLGRDTESVDSANVGMPSGPKGNSGR